MSEGRRTVVLEKRGDVAMLLLDRSSKFNRISPQMIQEFYSALDIITSKWMSKSLIIGGLGQVFCEGVELEGVRHQYMSSNLSGNDDTDEFQRMLANVREMIVRICRLRIPTIAMINGKATGAGFDLAYACDLRIGSERACFEHPLPGWQFPGLSHFFATQEAPPATVGASDSNYVPVVLNAEEAMEVGLLNKLVPSVALEEVTMQAAMELARPTAALGIISLLRKERWVATFAEYQPQRNIEVVLHTACLEPLTPREKEILHLMLSGLASREIASRIHVSYATVRNHTQSILSKLGVRSKVEAISLFTGHHQLSAFSTAPGSEYSNMFAGAAI